MRVSFHGAAREVTGSCHRIENRDHQFLLDCGMIQGGKERHDRNREPFAFDPAKVDAVVLSHAHIDHSGRLPLLCKAGFGGPILATKPTVELCKILLRDSARIQEEDARWKIKRLSKRHEDASWVRPLYTTEDVECILDRFVPVGFDEPTSLAGGARATFTKAGHILGAAIVRLELPGAGSAPVTLTFSGDLGVRDARLVGGPRTVACPDYLLIESTYGDRRRDDEGDKTERLFEVVDATVRRGGKVIVPSFAIGRTQAVLARLNDLVEAGRLAGVPVFVDSPMAIAATRVFTMFPDAYSPEARRRLRRGDEPLAFDGLTFTESVEASKKINDVRGPCVILSASGMATAGRIKHHLSNHISDPANTVLFVGYQAHGTLGRLIQEGTNPVRIFGEWHRVRAHVETLDGFSAHADQGGLLEWFGGLGGVPRRTWVVHGEESAALTLASLLGERFGARTEVPRRDQAFDLD